MESRFISRREYSNDLRDNIIISFSQSVQITTSDFPAFVLLDFLSKLGGSLGLWLGVGVVQILELCGTLLLPLCTCGNKGNLQFNITQLLGVFS